MFSVKFVEGILHRRQPASALGVKRVEQSRGDSLPENSQVVFGKVYAVISSGGEREMFGELREYTRVGSHSPYPGNHYQMIAWILPGESHSYFPLFSRDGLHFTNMREDPVEVREASAEEVKGRKQSYSS